jgi:hypothetical protein
MLDLTVSNEKIEKRKKDINSSEERITFMSSSTTLFMIDDIEYKQTLRV